MSRGLRSAIGGAILLAASIVSGTRNAWSQEQQPPSDEAPASGSLLDQIRALRQMGYLPSNPDQQPAPPSGHQPIDDLMPWIFGPLEGSQ